MKTRSDKTAKPWIKHIWEIHAHLKCPLIGACLSVNEHKTILKRCGHRIRGLTAYGLHQAIMSRMESENRVSQKIDRLLRHKYGDDLAKLLGLKGEAFLSQWDRRFSAGNMEGVFYVSAVKDAPPVAVMNATSAYISILPATQSQQIFSCWD